MVIPLGMCLFYSFTNWDGISKKFKMIGFKNFARLFADASFYSALKVTLVITLITVVIYNVLGKRVTDMSKKGIYIVNGKKYVVK